MRMWFASSVRARAELLEPGFRENETVLQFSRGIAIARDFPETKPAVMSQGLDVIASGVQTLDGISVTMRTIPSAKRRPSPWDDRSRRILAINVAAVAFGTAYRAWSMCEENTAYS